MEVKMKAIGSEGLGDGVAVGLSVLGDPPDPAVDFDAWCAHLEMRVRAQFVASGKGATVKDLPELFAALVAGYEACEKEIDAMADRLGIPIAPLGENHAAEAERMVAIDIAVATMPPYPADITVDEIGRLMIERARSVLHGELQSTISVEVEEAARERVARIFERRSRGETTYFVLAAKLRRTRFPRRR